MAGEVPKDTGETIDRLRREIRLAHYSWRTEQSYTEAVGSFLRYFPSATPTDLTDAHVKSYLEHLAVERGVSASTQNHAFSAILFLFRRVLGHDLGNLSATLRAKRVRRLPVVLSHEEIARLLAAAEGTTGLMIRLMYGTGMRLMECLQLRVKEVDFDRNSILVRSGKGNKDRTVMLPEKLKEPLQAHVIRLKGLFASDREAEVPGVWLPDALSVKYPNAGKEWGWQWMFPSKQLGVDPRTLIRRRHHLHENALQKAAKGEDRITAEYAKYAEAEIVGATRPFDRLDMLPFDELRVCDTANRLRLGGWISHGLRIIPTKDSRSRPQRGRLQLQST